MDGLFQFAWKANQLIQLAHEFGCDIRATSDSLSSNLLFTTFKCQGASMFHLPRSIARLPFLLLVLALFVMPQRAYGFAYIFAGDANGVDVVAHPQGYLGTNGGDLVITLGIDPDAANASQMIVSAQNVVNTLNARVATTGNLDFSMIENDEIDFESVLLHEVTHSLGLAHPNAASESGLPGAAQNYTRATAGPVDPNDPVDPVFELNAGADGVIGSADDIRGDDVNLNYFKIADNDPFTLATTIDSTTYSRDLADLPAGDVFSTNPDRTVANNLFGLANTESVMQQGTFFGEVQRTLGADDVAGLLYGQSGIDEIAGTDDDYNIVLNFVGLDSTADIVIDDSPNNEFAFSANSAFFIAPNHVSVLNNGVFFDANTNFFFNEVSNAAVAVPEPSSFVMLGVVCMAFVRRRRS